MFTFTEAQMGMLQAQVDVRFARAEAAHLVRYAPQLAELAGPAGLEAAVHIGLATARRAGFTEARQIRLLLQLMTHFGSHFDTDPQYAWLQPCLDAGSAQTSPERARLMYWHATLYLDRAYGPRGVHGISAALKASRFDLAAYAAIGVDFHARSPQWLARLHPQRVPYLSRETAAALIEAAACNAAPLGLAGAAGAPLLLALMFGFGHRVADDPLHPWVAQVIATPGLDGEAKTSALHVRTQATLAALLEPVTEARH